MAPDMPVRTRALTDLEERLAPPLGSTLSDGYVVVDRRLANAAKVGARELDRRRRKTANRSRARNRRS